MASAETLECADCGQQNLASAIRCSQCHRFFGQTSPPTPTRSSPPPESKEGDLPEGPVPLDQPPLLLPWRRVRPLWRVAALVAATFGLYWFYWYWATWRELKQ